MYMKIDLKSKLEKAGAIGVGAARAGQALAFAMPFMIQEENADFKPVGVDNNIVVIEHTSLVAAIRYAPLRLSVLTLALPLLKAQDAVRLESVLLNIMYLRLLMVLHSVA